jgi:hypothetical protein
VRQRLGAALAAPGAEACRTAGTGWLSAASERGAEGGVVVARVVGAVDRIHEFAAWVPFGLELATDSKLESDTRVFGFAPPEQGPREDRAQNQQPEVERAEFLLAIGYGLPRGP